MIQVRVSLFLIVLLITGACDPADTDTDREDSWMLSGFVKADSVNPVLQPLENVSFNDPVTGKTVEWASRNVLNPAAVVRNDTVFLFFRAQDRTGTSRIGLALSADGLHFDVREAPVFYPENDEMKEYEWSYLKEDDPECSNCFDGVEDPRIVSMPGGGYVMTYTAYDGRTARMALAVSDDLYHWEKKGLILTDSSLVDSWSKSGAIVARKEGDQVVAARIRDKYWMYFGDTDLFMAVSDDLITWNPLRNEENGALIRVMHPRAGYFDSRLVEPGPFALLTDDGILLLYNGSNAANSNDPGLPAFTYAAGQALFSADAPYRLIDRSDSYFLHPEKPYEITGEVNQVCFIEGLVHHSGHWFLYYGTADSRIAVAAAPATENN